MIEVGFFYFFATQVPLTTSNFNIHNSYSMSSSLSSSEKLQDGVIIDTATPTTAFASATANDTLPSQIEPNPEFRYNYLPYQFHQFYNDNRPEALARQLHNLHLPTVEGQLQIRAVMNMIHFFTQTKQNILDCIILMKTILDCKTDDELQEIRERLDKAVVNEEIYPDVARLFEYIVCTSFEEESISSQSGPCEYFDEKECERNQLEDIGWLAVKDLRILRQLVHDMTHVVRHTAALAEAGLVSEEIPGGSKNQETIDKGGFIDAEECGRGEILIGAVLNSISGETMRASCMSLRKKMRELMNRRL